MRLHSYDLGHMQVDLLDMQVHMSVTPAYLQKCLVPNIQFPKGLQNPVLMQVCMCLGDMHMSVTPAYIRGIQFLIPSSQYSVPNTQFPRHSSQAHCSKFRKNCFKIKSKSKPSSCAPTLGPNKKLEITGGQKWGKDAPTSKSEILLTKIPQFNSPS